MPEADDSFDPMKNGFQIERAASDSVLVAEPLDGDLRFLEKCLFVLIWGFPEPSQTFIQREMQQMARRGGRIRVLAGHRVARSDLDSSLSSIADDALYLGSVLRRFVAGIAYAIQHPRQFGDVLVWGLRLPHRTLSHRLRMATMVLVAASVADRVRESGFTYLHAHFAAYHTEFVMALSRLTGLPYGFTAHATGIWKDRNILAEKIAGARLVMTCSQYNADHLRNLATQNADVVHLVYHGLDMEEIREAPPIPAGKATRFLAVGRLVPKKGFADLIAAFARLIERGYDAHLTIFGDGPERAHLGALISRHGISEVVSMPGTVINRMVLEAIGQSNVFVAPSVRGPDGNLDGIPHVILEAMTMGRPVVASRISGIPEVVIPGETGLLTEPGNVDALADAMASLCSDRSFGEEMGRNARRLVVNRFDVSRNARLQLDLLAEAIRTREEANVG